MAAQNRRIMTAPYQIGVADLIKQLVDPTLILHSLGISMDRVSSGEVRGPCPVHGGDNKTAFRFKLDTGHWQCFSHGCHEGASDIIGLVMKVRNISFSEAIKYLAEYTGIDLTQDNSATINRAMQAKEIYNFINRIEKNNLNLNLCTIYNIDTVVKQLNESRTDFFIKKGYSAEILDYFEVGGEWVDPHNIIREAIAIRDNDGNLVAIDGRRTDGDDEPRYFAQPKGFKKEQVLYHYFKAREWIPAFGGKLFIVEGYKACWSMIKAGFLNTVACMGAGLSRYQPEILYANTDLKEIILLLDGDTAGYNGARRSAGYLRKIFSVKIIDFPLTKPITDPSTLDTAELIQIIQENV